MKTFQEYCARFAFVVFGVLVGACILGLMALVIKMVGGGA